jgi:hypothetical protein
MYMYERLLVYKYTSSRIHPSRKTPDEHKAQMNVPRRAESKTSGN